jgi:endonuclease YncB( thermonuclease family)
LSHVPDWAGVACCFPRDAAPPQRDAGGLAAVSDAVHGFVRPGLALLLALGLVGAADVQEFRGRVVGVRDGDTITVLHDGRPTVIRLHGIDAPEKGQAFGMRAKAFTASLAFGQTVIVHVRGLDRYGRNIGDITLSDGRRLDEELVRAGYAWWFRRYSGDARLKTLEAQARVGRRGLWADPDPVPPWDWRRSQAGTRARAGRR